MIVEDVYAIIMPKTIIYIDGNMEIDIFFDNCSINSNIQYTGEINLIHDIFVGISSRLQNAPPNRHIKNISVIDTD